MRWTKSKGLGGRKTVKMARRSGGGAKLVRLVRMDRGRVDLEGSVVTWRCRTKEGRRGEAI